jgi:hypothetical protein
MNQTRKFISPRMEIIDNCDSVINELDIYTEIFLRKLVNDDDKLYIAQYFPKKEQAFKYNHYSIQYYANDKYSGEYEFNLAQIPPAPMEIKEYINKSRANAIEAITKVRNEILESYNANAIRLKRDWSKMDDPKEMEQLRQDLFGEKFCFGIEINAQDRVYSRLFDRLNCSRISSKPAFKFCTIISDFYLSEIEIKKLR